MAARAFTSFFRFVRPRTGLRDCAGLQAARLTCRTMSSRPPNAAPGGRLSGEAPARPGPRFWSWMAVRRLIPVEWRSSSTSTRSIQSRRWMPARSLREVPMCGAVSQIIGCEIHPLNNVRVLKRIAAQLGARARPPRTPGIGTGLPRGSAWLEAYLVDARARRPPSATATPSRWRTSAWCRRSSTRSASGCPLDDYR